MALRPSTRCGAPRLHYVPADGTPDAPAAAAPPAPTGLGRALRRQLQIGSCPLALLAHRPMKSGDVTELQIGVKIGAGHWVNKIGNRLAGTRDSSCKDSIVFRTERKSRKRMLWV